MNDGTESCSRSPSPRGRSQAAPAFRPTAASPASVRSSPPICRIRPSRCAQVEDAATADARVRELLRKPLNPTARCRSRCSTIAACRRPTTSSASPRPTMVRQACRPIRRSRSSGLSGPARSRSRRGSSPTSSRSRPCRRAPISPPDRFRQAQLRAARGDAARRRRDAARLLPRGRGARSWSASSSRRKSAAETAASLPSGSARPARMNKLDQAREQVFYAEITAQLATARQRAASERERLIRALGLWGGDLDFRLPVAAAAAAARAPQRCRQSRSRRCARRVDLQIARIEARRAGEVLRADPGHALHQSARGRRHRQDQAASARPASVSRERGFEVEFQIPLFDFGEVRVRAGRADLHAGGQPADREGGQRPLGGARRLSQSIARPTTSPAHYRREVLPLRKIISDETLLRYNAMQIDVFALLAEARQRIAATIAAIEAQREFWLAEHRSRRRRRSAAASPARGQRAIATTPQPPTGAGGH